MQRRSNPPPKQRIPFEIWALVASAFAVALGFGVVGPAIPQFALEFGVSNFWASAMISAFALMRVLGAPLGGWLIARIGERRTHAIGLLSTGAATGICVIAANFPQLLVLRALGGLGSAATTIATTALVIKLSPPEARARVASLNAAGWTAGSIVGPIVGALVAGLGLRAPFLFYFFAVLIATAVVWFALRRSKVIPRGKTDRSASNPMPLREALRIAQYRSLLVSGFGVSWATYGVQTSVVPLFALAAFGGNPSDAAWVLAAYAIGNTMFIIPAGRWNDLIGRKPILLVGIAVLTAGYFLLPASPQLWVALVIMFAAGAGSALVNPGQQAVLADVVGPREGGSPIATFSMLCDMGAVVGPLVAGAIVDLAGFGWAFSTTAAMLVVAAVAWTIVPDSRRLHAR